METAAREIRAAAAGRKAFFDTLTPAEKSAGVFSASGGNAPP